jgi:hypothetical protein
MVAEKLGRTVKELEESMDSAELTEWGAFMRLQNPKARNAKTHVRDTILRPKTPDEQIAAVKAVLGG